MEKSLSPFLFEAESPVIFGQALAVARRREPVYFDELRGCWVLLGHKDIAAALRRPQAFAGTAYGPAPVGEVLSALDGLCGAQRLHGRPAAATLRACEERVIVPVIHRVIDRLAARSAAGEGVDLVAEFCAVLPGEVATALLGLSPASVAACSGWARDLAAWVRWFDDPAIVAGGREAFWRMTDHLHEPLPRARQDLLGDLVEEPLGLLVALLYTAPRSLVCTLGSLLLHPESLRRLQMQPALLQPAVDEALRWTSPRSGLLVRLSADACAGAVKLPAGASVLLCTAAAHYDESVYPGQELYDIGRQQRPLPAWRPATLADAVAQALVRAGLAILLSRVPGLRLLPSAHLRRSGQARASGLFDPSRLLVLCDPPQAAQAA